MIRFRVHLKEKLENAAFLENFVHVLNGCLPYQIYSFTLLSILSICLLYCLYNTFSSRLNRNIPQNLTLIWAHYVKPWINSQICPKGNSASYHLGPLQRFFSFRPWLDTLKLEGKRKFQVLGSSGTLIFRPSRTGPWDQKMSFTMQKWGLAYVSRFHFLREVFTE